MALTMPDGCDDSEYGFSVISERQERCMQSGPRMKWSEVMQLRHCKTEEMCAVFKDRHPSTVAMTVLVVVEMFNALNALSENNSLLQARGCPFHGTAMLRKRVHVHECVLGHGGPLWQQGSVSRGRGLGVEATGPQIPSCWLRNIISLGWSSPSL